MNANYYTDASMLLVKIILCSEFHDRTVDKNRNPCKIRGRGGAHPRGLEILPKTELLEEFEIKVWVVGFGVVKSGPWVWG